MKILIVGDSQAEGAPGRAVETRLRAAGHEVRRIGYVGHGAYDWTRMHWDEYQSALRGMRPDQVMMIFGSNDPPNARLEQAMQTFKASAPKVYYAGPPRYDRRPDVQAVSAGIRTMASRVFGGKHLDAWPHTGTSTPRAGDGLHFTRSGGAVWAEGLMRDWSSSLGSQLSRVGGGLPVWVGPAILGGAAVIGLGLFLMSRRR